MTVPNKYKSVVFSLYQSYQNYIKKATWVEINPIYLYMFGTATAVKTVSKFLNLKITSMVDDYSWV
jgi:hypothetical protein